MMVFNLWGDVVEMWSYRDAQPRLLILILSANTITLSMGPYWSILE